MAKHTAKIYDIEEMKELADLYLIELDLELVDQIISNFEYIEGSLSAFDFKRKSFVSAALIHYRRVFSSGVRLRLTIDDVPFQWIDLHDEVISVANCHTAHSVNEYECGLAALNVKVQSGEVEVTGIRYSMQGNAEISAHKFDELVRLCRYLRDHVVKNKKHRLEHRVLQEARNLTQEQLLALPCGIMVGRSSQPHPKKRRTR